MSPRTISFLHFVAASLAASTFSFAQESSALAEEGNRLYVLEDGRLVEIDKETLEVRRSLELSPERTSRAAREEGTGRPPEVQAPLRREAVVLAPTTKDGVRTNYADASVVHLPDGRYRMYANTFDEDRSGDGGLRNPRLVTAVSSDGLFFELEAEIGFPGVATERIFPFEGGYRLYYPKHDGPRSGKRILSAFSKDGVDFAKDRGTRIEPLVSAGSVGGPTIYRLPDGRYRMLFDESAEPDEPGRVTSANIAGATSDDGLAWVRDAEPTIDAGEDETEAGQAVHPFVLPWEGRYLLFYGVHGATRAALSEDGFRFKRLGFLFRGADPDAHVLEDGRIRLYYGDYTEREGGGIYLVHLSPEEILESGR